jgi:hypothetical protein
VRDGIPFPCVYYAKKDFCMVNYDLEMVEVKQGTPFNNTERYPHIFEMGGEKLYFSISAIYKNPDWFALELKKPTPPPERTGSDLFNWKEEKQ